MKSEKWLFVLFLFFSQCASPVMEGEDAGPDYACDENVNFLTDFMNCGGCGKEPEEGSKFRCDPTTADECKNGQCICSAMHNKCISGSEECKLGVCAQPDVLGATSESTSCEFDHQCPGVRMCVLGVCSEVPCADENGEPQIRSCYSGYGNTYENPPCHKGYTVCFGGHWNPCLEEVVPVPEDGIYLCDNLDNDCDGCSDGSWVDGVCVKTERHGADIVIIIDTSPSMNDNCEAVLTAATNIIAGFNGASDIRFAIVLMPRNGGSCESGLLQDFADGFTFINTLSNVVCNGGSSEGSWDVIRQVAGNEPIYDITESIAQNQDIYTTLSWRPDTSQVIIMFTDEPGQHYLLEEHGYCRLQPDSWESWMCEEVTSQLVAVFNERGLLEQFDECAMTYEIAGVWNAPDEDQLELDMKDFLGHVCD